MSARNVVNGAPAEWTGDGAYGAGYAEPFGARPVRRGRGFWAWCAALLLAVVSVVAGCRAADTDGVTPVPQLLAFWPWLIAPTVLAMLLAAFARSRTGLVWALALLGTLAWFMEPYGQVAEAHGAPVANIRVLTSNVEVGAGTPALTGVIRRERPDIVFVEECDARCFTALDTAFGAGTAATGTGAGTESGTEAVPGAPGTYPYRRAGHAPGAHGAVILSRFPLRGSAPVRGTTAMPGAVADVHGHQIRLQLAHPMPPLPGKVGVWRTELGALRDFAAGAGDASVILAGDFNASQDHAAFRRILDAGLRDGARLAGAARTPSWPSSTAPTFGAQIDHVLVSPDFSAGTARFLTLSGTDHRALLTDLTLHG